MKLIALLTLTLLASCGKDESMKIIHNNDRVTMLEARMQLVDSNILLLKSRIEALDSSVFVLESDLVSLQSASEVADAQLQANIDSLSAETVQSISGILAQIDELNQADEDFQDLDIVIETDSEDIIYTFQATENRYIMEYKSGPLLKYLDTSYIRVYYRNKPEVDCGNAIYRLHSGLQFSIRVFKEIDV